MEQANCPETALAELYAMKRLDPFALENFESHAPTCPSCMRILAMEELGPLEVELLMSG